MRLAFALLLTLFVGSAIAGESSLVSDGGLGRLMLEGRELHPSLVTPSLDDRPARHVARVTVQSNPQFSTDATFVNAIARSGSQGNLGGEGVRAALYALYVGDRDVGIYGMEAASASGADRLEAALRKIWSHNVSIDRARVHREGLVVVVVWNDGVSSEIWEAVNATVSGRLSAP